MKEAFRFLYNADGLKVGVERETWKKGKRGQPDRRVWVKSEERFWSGGRVVEDRRYEAKEGRDPKRVDHRFFLSANGMNLGELHGSERRGTFTDRPSEDLRYVTDALGSTVATLEGDGGVGRWMSYSPFGVELGRRRPHEDDDDHEHGEGRPALTFTGLWREGAPGGVGDELLGAQFRHYRPGLGRWAKRDPIGFDGGQSNLYGYVGNRPTVGRDITGLRVAFIGGGSQTVNSLGNILGVAQDVTAQKLKRSFEAFAASKGLSEVFGETAAFSFGQIGDLADFFNECGDEPSMIVALSAGADRTAINMADIASRLGVAKGSLDIGRNIDFFAAIDPVRPVTSLFPDPSFPPLNHLLPGVVSRPARLNRLVSIYQRQGGDQFGYKFAPLTSGDIQINANSNQFFNLETPVLHHTIAENGTVQGFIWSQMAKALEDFGYPRSGSN